MNKQPEALRLAELLDETHVVSATTNNRCQQAATELRRLQHNIGVLMDALWKACGDDEEVVNAMIESQGALK